MVENRNNSQRMRRINEELNNLPWEKEGSPSAPKPDMGWVSVTPEHIEAVRQFKARFHADQQRFVEMFNFCGRNQVKQAEYIMAAYLLESGASISPQEFPNATPGPWAVDEEGKYLWIVNYAAHPENECIALLCDDTDTGFNANCRDDFALIVAAVNAYRGSRQEKEHKS